MTTTRIIKDLRETNQRLQLENQELHTQNKRLESRLDQMDARMDFVIAMLEVLVADKKEARRDPVSRLQQSMESETILCSSDEETVEKSVEMEDAQVGSSSSNWHVLSAVSHGDALCDWTSNDSKKTTGIGTKESDDCVLHSQTTLRSSVAQVARYEEVCATAAAAPTKMEVKTDSTAPKMESKGADTPAATTSFEHEKFRASDAARDAKLKADSFAAKMQIKDPALAAKFKAGYKATQLEFKLTARDTLADVNSLADFLEIKADALTTLFKANWMHRQGKFDQDSADAAAKQGHSCCSGYAIPCRCFSDEPLSLIRVPPLVVRSKSEPVLSEMEEDQVVYQRHRVIPNVYYGAVPVPPFYRREVISEWERYVPQEEPRWTSMPAKFAVGCVLVAMFTAHLADETTSFVKRRLEVWLGRREEE
ncbi:hypothetical protein HDU98_012341 [Podochytrium sp. JEL0797]|nr:hypothetical protein HDU98_012341 [Podochytrium sp. JEL0797]